MKKLLPIDNKQQYNNSTHRIKVSIYPKLNFRCLGRFTQRKSQKWYGKQDSQWYLIYSVINKVFAGSIIQFLKLANYITVCF